MTVGSRDERVGDSIQVLEDDAVLNHGVWLPHFVERTGGVEQDRAGVDAAIDLEQRHADAGEIAVREGGPSQVFVTPEWPDPVAREVRELPALREEVRDLAKRIQPEAEEPMLEVRLLTGTSGSGYYFTATERDAGPGEFRFMSQGALQLDELTLWFTILTNEGEDTIAVDALAMLQAAVHRRTGLDQL